MATATVVHFEIPARNTGRLRTFYEKAFGWKFKDSGMPGMTYLLITTGPRGSSVGGGMYQRMSASDRPRNFIGVGNIDRAIQRFKAAGGKQRVPKVEIPGQGWSFIGTDPEGNPIALFQPAGRRRRS
jgi:uncharacterized protein